jgi:probable phosphoglycerate mutase
VQGRGGEEAAAVADRAVAALVDLPPAPVAVVVTHGGTAGRLLERLLGLGPEHRRAFGPLANCAWSELAAQGGRWRLLRHNISALAVHDGHVDGSPEAAPAPSPGPAPAVGRPDGPPHVADADAVV